jgi:uncharacterized protein YndB with AHSA1/START domain
MQHVEVTRVFPAPPQAVWDVYTDHARWKEWAGIGASRLERAGEPDPNGSGAVRALGPAFFAAHEEVLDFEPPERMTYRIVKGGFPVHNHLGEVRFEPEGEGTRVTWGCRFESRIPGFGGLLERFITRFFAGALEGLARHSFSD